MCMHPRPSPDHPEMQQQVFSASAAAPGRLRPLQTLAGKAEKSVRIMPVNCGGLGLFVDGAQVCVFATHCNTLRHSATHCSTHTDSAGELCWAGSST